MKRGRQWTALALSGLLAAGGILCQIVPATAEQECTCQIQVHGSNCPLSLCTCEGLETGEHTEGCELYGKNSDLTACVCEPDVHGEGCPRYGEEGESITLLSEAGPEEAAVDTADNPEADGQQALSEEESEDSREDADESETLQAETEETEEENTPAQEESASAEEEDPSDGDEAVPDAGETEETDPAENSGTGTAGEQETAPADETDGTGETQEAEEPENGNGSAEDPGTSSGTETVRDPDTEPLEVEVPEDLDAMEEGWEYPSGWSGYGDGQMEGNLTVAAEAFALETQLRDHILEVQGLLTNGENARLSEEEGRFGDVLAVYALLSGKTEEYPYGASLEDETEAELFRSVYWSMTQVTGVSNARGAAVSVKRLDVEEAAELYGFTDAQLQEALSLAGQGDTVAAIVDESIFASLSEEELEALWELVPEDISAERRAVLLAAAALDGKVDYFWGGKSLAYGWDDRWGEMRTVASEGSSTYGTARPFGLDCSGFVSWAFLNAFGSEDSMGSGTGGQWSVSGAVEWAEAQPGDLVFYYPPDSGSTNHVGIVLTVDENGPETVVHCSGSKGVNISGAEGFSYVRRPLAYSE